MFLAALEAEGIPCDGRFYEPVYRSDLFHVTAEEFPQLRLGGREIDYRRDFDCPVSVRAAYEQSVWLPQFLLLGDERDVDDIVKAVEKVMAARGRLAAADPALAALKRMSRAERPKVETHKNY